MNRNERRRARYAKLRAAGRCVVCRARVEEGIYCETHREQHNEWARERYPAEKRGRYRR